MKMLLLLLCFITLTACSNIPKISQQKILLDETQAQTSPKVPPLKSDLFEVRELEISEEDIFRLSEKQKEDFLSFYHASLNKKVPRHKRVSHYVSEFYDSFSYRGSTYIASDTLQLKQGNCLSLVIMTAALSELVSLDYKFRLVHTQPLFEAYDDVITVAQHIDLSVYDRTPNDAFNANLVLPAKITIDYFPSPSSIRGRWISKDEIKVMFYQNKAADALIESDLNLAFAFIRRALVIDELNPEALNTLAVLYNKVGAPQEAVNLYEFMFSQQLISLAAVDNYVAILNSQRKTKKARELLNEYDGLRDQNPYTFIQLAEKFLAEDELRLAEKYALKSAELAPYLHQTHFSLARIYSHWSKFGQARKALKKAHELSYTHSDKLRYLSKLESLH